MTGRLRDQYRYAEDITLITIWLREYFLCISVLVYFAQIANEIALQAAWEDTNVAIN